MHRDDLPWAPPDPAARLGPGHPVPGVEATRPPARRRRRALAAGVAAVVALGAAGAAFALSDAASRASVRVSAPAERAPRPTAPVPAPTGGAGSGSTATSSLDRATLTRGLVDITTTLTYQQGMAAGTGIVLTPDGEVLTNNHVIAGSTSIKVTVVATGASYDASVVGTDKAHDVAVLQLQGAHGLTAAALGDSSTVKPGDAVVGVGNAGGRGTPSVSAGTVTALGRTITAADESGAGAETLHNLIQTTARLQPGQSGGPLLDAGGKVVGIDAAGSAGNVRMRSRSGTGEGYAIPIDDALAAARAIESGTPSPGITLGTPPLLGVTVDPSSSGNGALVGQVVAGTPAASLGLRAGDRITGIDASRVASPADLTAALHGHKAGDRVTVTWTGADGASHKGSAVLVAGPAD